MRRWLVTSIPAASSEAISLEQRLQIDHHAIPDHGLHAGAQNPARDQLEDELLFANKDGVAGVVAALISGDDVETFGEQVDDFPLAFVPPLRTENDDVAHVLEAETPDSNLL